jgi:AraC-like DNA-binding protein
MAVAERLNLQDAVWVRQLLDELAARGHAPGPMLARVGLRTASVAKPRSKIPFEAAVALFEAAAAVTGEDDIGLRLAQSRDVRDMGLLGYVGLSSATLLDGIRNVARYKRVFTEGVQFDLSALHKTGEMGVRLRVPDDVPSRQHREFTVAGIVRAMRQLSGRTITPDLVTFSHTRTEGTAAFERYFGCEVGFGRPRTTIVLKATDLAIPLVRSDDRLLEVLRAQCEHVLDAMPDDRPSIVEQVERRIVDRLGAGAVKLDAVAASLGMSPRTLARRLADADTTFQAVLEAVRQRLATRYLEQDELRLDDVAALLGYSETSAFVTAFRRWTGTTPGRFRASQPSAH